MNYKKEIIRLYDLEYGAGPEKLCRFAGLSIGSLLLYLYTGWLLAGVWLVGYAIAQLAYFWQVMALVRREAHLIRQRDMLVTSGLFLLVLVSVMWMPCYMLVQPDKVLVLVGAALVGCLLVFLVRRADTLLLIVVGEVVIVSIFAIGVFSTQFVQIDSVVARAGVVLAACALVGYFADALRYARRQRLVTEDAAKRSSQVQKMAAVGQLAGGVAHEFNNKLTAIMGSLELLRELDDPAEREASIETAFQAATEAARTVRHLMVYARKEPFKLEFIDSQRLAQQVLAQVRGLITGMIEVDLQQESAPPTLYADRKQLMMAITNLVVNAVDAMPEGGKLGLKISRVDHQRGPEMADGSYLKAGPYVAIAVSDSGEGIAPGDLPKVVEPFFSTKPVGKGTGLGLSMVLGMAREHGGGLSIASDASGTVATIYLPYIDPVVSADGQAGA